MTDQAKFKCKLCGRELEEPRTCCGQWAGRADEVHVSKPAEPWMCPVCGTPSDTPTTCCGKRAVRNPDFQG